MQKYFLTTAIDYVNSLPHIGTAYEKIGADVLARYYRLAGSDVLFQMGNDEHSQNVVKSAQKQNLEPLEYCNQMRPQFEEVWARLNISYDQFVQTTSPIHFATVKKLFEAIHQKGDIYQGEYTGLYCDSCEAFYTEKDLTEAGLCPQHLKEPRQIKEANYFFRLSKYAATLKKHIEENPTFILPKSRRNEILKVLEEGLKDISVSRASQNWGIPLPIDESHVVYVWFDALINYLSLIDYTNEGADFQKHWPADVHIIGKDITRFHCLIWPAMLLSAGLALPTTIFGHGFVYLKGERMSKSLGNVVSPMDIIDEYGADSLRYYLLRNSSFGDDGQFTWDDFILRYNSDLANGLGNLAARVGGMISRYFNGELELVKLSDAASLDLVSSGKGVFSQLSEFLDPLKSHDIYFNRALDDIWQYISRADRYVDQTQPWVLAKEDNKEKLAEVLSALVFILFDLSLLLAAFIPDTAQKIWQFYSFDSLCHFDQINLKLCLSDIKKITLKQKRLNLFPRIENKEQK